jgi:hypothetical protein
MNFRRQVNEIIVYSSSGCTSNNMVSVNGWPLCMENEPGQCADFYAVVVPRLYS